MVPGSASETVSLTNHIVKTVSGYLAELRATNNRGAWGTTTAYAVKDAVSDSGTWFVCVEAHTSGTFSTDLAAGKWALYQIDFSSNVALTGDFSVDTTIFVVDSLNNRVGIGTASPGSALHVSSGVSAFRFGGDGTGVSENTGIS